MHIGIRILSFVGIAVGGSVGFVLICCIFAALFALGLSLVLAATSAIIKITSTKPDRASEQTDKFWLAIISPYHAPSKAHYEDHSVRGRLWLMSFVMVEIIFFLPVVLMGTIYLTPEAFRFVVTH